MSSLLPPNATPWERLIEQCMAAPESVWQASLKVGDVKSDLLDETLPFLVYEYGLDQVAQWVPDLRRLLADGRRWQRIRGTPRAIEIALAWIDETPRRIEEHSAERWHDLFQLALDSPVSDPARLARIIALTRLSKSAHTDLIRIYNDDYDLRALKINAGRVNGRFLLNDWSGRWVRPDWPKLSFGRRTVARVDASIGVASVDIAGSVDKLQRSAGFRINRGRLNATPRLEILARDVAQSVSVGSVGAAHAGGWPDGPWPDGPYANSFATAVSASTQDATANTGDMIEIAGLLSVRSSIAVRPTDASAEAQWHCGASAVWSTPAIALPTSSNAQLLVSAPEPIGATGPSIRADVATALTIGTTQRETIYPWPSGPWPEGPWPGVGFASRSADQRQIQ